MKTTRTRARSSVSRSPSTAINIVYTPLRMVFGATGAALGGFSGWVSGGDLRTAKGWWVNTTEGDYYVRPAHLDRTTCYRITGAVSCHPPLETYGEPVPATEPEEVVVEPDYEPPRRSVESARGIARAVSSARNSAT